MITTPPPRRIPVAGLLGTLLLLAVVAVCLRLGFWQLARRAERLEQNARITARMQLAPLHENAALADSAGALFRVALLSGEYDDARSIVLPGRSLRGVPGVHLLAPLRVAPDTAVLVNRGWLPSPDGATVELDSVPPESAPVRGLVLPFPGAAESLAPVRDARRDTAFRRVWFAVDPVALRAQFPYALLPVVVQLLPAAEAARYPHRLEPPVLDAGPHLSYAIQWFSFAAIGLIGWVALVRRSRQPRHELDLVPDYPPPA